MNWNAKNQKNKAVIWNYWQRMNNAKPNDIKEIVRKHLIKILTGMVHNLLISCSELMRLFLNFGNHYLELFLTYNVFLKFF